MYRNCFYVYSFNLYHDPLKKSRNRDVHQFAQDHTAYKQCNGLSVHLTYKAFSFFFPLIKFTGCLCLRIITQNCKHTAKPAVFYEPCKRFSRVFFIEISTLNL